ncbi:hypothetical protein CR3_0292 [Cupriavidus gilardii CR3]|uniref:Uncharacterized protein n=1 Tax=Cupriavidus gilardii TaxID=82541 RepID=A0A849B9P1_9BURK|nr:hypothetical protein [Cupriavidus gilardii]ALD89550.1 hypothetical protein CR3_0292 [Cupriavidus gilardii CR3]KAB0595126.1 hypothetical protein F7Q96_18915 [Cupriavidus gilardii]MCT9016638.1 hypothetical protein [Cupriavidus gilardii]MCT9056387.1 hypothetical protein [Cupriavidus gilardii]NNH12441.1 hypothetical protein [Cupriavidus gilardii]
MGSVRGHVTYASWLADRHGVLPGERRVAFANAGLYYGWSSIALYRVGAFIDSITAFFRANPSSALLTTRFTAEGARHTVSQAGIALGSVASFAEMIITSVVFGQHANRHQRTGRQIDDNGEGHEAFVNYVRCRKSDAQKTKLTGAITSEGLEPDAEHEVCSAERDISIVQCSTGGRVKEKRALELAVSYLEYETAQIDHREAAHTLKHSSVMFARDGILQGGGVGCNLALLWDSFKVSELLHLAAVPINATATAICGFAFSLGCGALHIVAGALRWHDGLKKLAAASGALEAINTAKERLKDAKESQQAELANAGRLAESLLRHAEHNEIRARDDARSQIRVGKWRISYGAAAMAVGAISLALFLVVGGVSTGGILFGIIGGLALAGWTLYAGIRNRNSAKSIQAAIDKGNNHAAASEEGGPKDNELPPLDDVIDQAVRMLDRTGGNDANARRLIKHTLKQIGLTREDLWPLRFCPIDPDVKDPIVEELKIKIRNLVDGDGIRRAVENGLQRRPEAKPAAEAEPVAIVV